MIPTPFQQSLPRVILALALGVTSSCTAKESEPVRQPEPPPSSPPSSSVAPPTQELSPFWKIVDSSLDPSEDAQLHKLREALLPLSEDSLIAFQTDFYKNSTAAFSYNLWGAAYIINGGCSDDCFDYFLAWLISRGHDVSNSAVANPDSLAELGQRLPSIAEFEQFAYVAEEVFEQRFGKRFPDSVYSQPADPGPQFDFEDLPAMRERYPKLFELRGPH